MGDAHRPVATAVDACRLAVGTFTAVPVAAPRHVDRTRAGLAMLLSPLCGALIGATVGAVVSGVHALTGSALVAGVAGAAAGAAFTRALHLDGLADMADGMGSGRKGEDGIAVMRRSDIGPFGVVALVLVVMAQAAAWATLVEGSTVDVMAGAALAYAAGRCVAAWSCRRTSTPPVDGFAATFLGSVPTSAAAALLGVVAAASVLVDGGPAAAAAAMAVGLLIVGSGRRRFRRVTGDVLGAAIEVGTTVALLVLLI